MAAQQLPELDHEYVAVGTNVLTVIGTVIVGWFAWLAAARQRRMSRISELERRVEKLEERERLWWIYCQSLIVHANTHAPGVPLPDPPDGLLD